MQAPSASVKRAAAGPETSGPGRAAATGSKLEAAGSTCTGPVTSTVTVAVALWAAAAAGITSHMTTDPSAITAARIP
jgi:hypothetical protein